MDPAEESTRAADPPCRYGWYGKLPSLGDFASRRLPAEWVEAWDDWLAAGLAAWRAEDPDGWLETYLAAPAWRFLALAGAIPGVESGLVHAGVLMPSVDRVGRYFPFTVAWQVNRLPQGRAAVEDLLRELQELEDLAVDALQDDWPVDRLESELARLEAQQQQRAAQDGAAQAPLPEPGELIDMGDSGDFSVQLGQWAAQSLIEQWSGCVLWLCDPGTGERALRMTQGLPAADTFPRLLVTAAPPHLDVADHG